jgi:hypothetical protein
MKWIFLMIIFTFVDAPFKARFITVDKIPIVKGKINGKDAFFIIDSGSSISIIDALQIDYYGIKENNDTTNITAIYGSNIYPKTLSDVNVTVEGVKFEGEYMSQNISNVVQVIYYNSGKKVSGIIGSNIMRKMKIIIDYSDKSIYIK